MCLGLLDCFYAMNAIPRIFRLALHTGLQFSPASFCDGRALAFPPEQQAGYEQKTCGKGPGQNYR